MWRTAGPMLYLLLFFLSVNSSCLVISSPHPSGSHRMKMFFVSIFITSTTYYWDNNVKETMFCKFAYYLYYILAILHCLEYNCVFSIDSFNRNWVNDISFTLYILFNNVTLWFHFLFCFRSYLSQFPFNYEGISEYKGINRLFLC